MEYVLSNEGKPKLLLDVFIYTRQNDLKAGVGWRHSKRSECKGAVVHSCGTRTVTVEHSHPPDNAAVNIINVKNKMRQVAEHSAENPAAVLRRTVQGMTEEDKARMTRKYPKEPVRLEDIVIENEWKTPGGISRAPKTRKGPKNQNLWR